MVDTIQEALFLFLLRNVEKEFSYDDAISCQVLFEVANIFEALRPNLFADEFRGQFLFPQEFRVHPDNEHLLIITTIEDSDMSAIRQAFHTTPEIIVIEILGQGRFERIDLAPLRIYSRHDVL